MDWLTPAIGFAKYVLTAFIMYGVFMLVERLRPVEPHQPWRHLWFNLRWYVLYSMIALTLQAIGIGKLVTLVQTRLGGALITLPEPSNGLVFGLLAIAYLLITDFFYYWFHRCQHKTAVLWSQHKFHHSETSLNVTSTRRVHWLEDPLIILFLALPMAILVEFPSLPIGILAFIEILWLQFIHMNFKLNLGVFSRIVTGPQYHRIHHSYHPEHIDKNFAAFFPIWDILFGTYHHPRAQEFPPTGLEDGRSYNNIWTANALPFREWFQKTLNS
ncbi:MAG: sterol desaturase family protein [Cyanobacteria bacterium P01_H01_bin.15]